MLKTCGTRFFAVWGMILLGAWIVSLSGCGSMPRGEEPVPAGFYRVRPGDTLIAIARQYGTTYQQLALWNNLREPYQIEVGSLLRIAPPETNPRPLVPLGPRPTPRATPPTSVTRQVAGITWRWPVEGRAVQYFSANDRTRQGVRIAAAAGTPVGAVADGTVVYSGSGLKGYGNLIIVKHDEHFLSAYGFNRRLIAREGERVSAGTPLAEVGGIGNESLLHLEIRRDGTAVDPLNYLPPLR